MITKMKIEKSKKMKTDIAAKKKALKVKKGGKEKKQQTTNPPASNILVSKDQVSQGISALFQLIQKTGSGKSELFAEEKEIFFQVTVLKVPKTPNRLLHIPLKHTVLTNESEVALIVPEVPGIDRKDHEKTIEHYEDYLRSKGVKGVTKIIPVNQLVQEYDQYELKLRLLHSYDAFLVDGKISGKVFHCLGKHFYKKRKMPNSVKLDCADLKSNFDLALRKVSMNLHSHGDNYTIQIGHTRMPQNHIAANAIEAIQFFKNKLPGGWPNIKALFVKAAGTTSIPIYYSLKSKADVPVPVVESKLPKALKAVSGDITTQEGVEVTVLPKGTVITNKRKAEEKESNKSKKQKKEKKKLEQENSNKDDDDFNEEEEIDYMQLRKELGIEDDDDDEEEDDDVEDQEVEEEEPECEEYTDEELKVDEKFKLYMKQHIENFNKSKDSKEKGKKNKKEEKVAKQEKIVKSEMGEPAPKKDKANQKDKNKKSKEGKKENKIKLDKASNETLFLEEKNKKKKGKEGKKENKISLDISNETSIPVQKDKKKKGKEGKKENKITLDISNGTSFPVEKDKKKKGNEGKKNKVKLDNVSNETSFLEETFDKGNDSKKKKKHKKNKSA